MFAVSLIRLVDYDRQVALLLIAGELNAYHGFVDIFCLHSLHSKVFSEYLRCSILLEHDAVTVSIVNFLYLEM